MRGIRIHPPSRRRRRCHHPNESCRGLSQNRSHSSELRAASGGRHPRGRRFDPGETGPGPTHPARPDRRADGRQPRHRQHPAHPAQHGRLPQETRRQTVPRPGDGQPRRRHRRGTAAASSKATASPRSSSACRIRASMDIVAGRRHARGLSRLARPHRLRGRPHRRRRPRQAAHRLPRPHRERPDEDDDDRPGQARRRPRLPPHPPRTPLRPGRPLGRPDAAGRRPHRLRPGPGRERLRRDGLDRSGRARRRSRRARSSCWPRRDVCWPGCRCARPTCSSWTRSARTSAARAWTPTSSAANAPSARQPPPGRTRRSCD